jgi:DNA-binding transcriptional LysR family regulator
MPGSVRAVDYRIQPFDLHLYLSVLEHGTITGAAKAIGLSLAATSERLAALEHAVGTRLLERSKHGARPTEAGRALGRNAHRVLAELDALHIDMAGFAKGLRGTVRVFGNTAAMSEALPSCIGKFLVDHPDIDLDLRELSSDAVLEAVRGGAADVGVVADYVDASGLTTRPWIDDELVCLLPSRHALAGTSRLAYADLLDEPFVGLGADSGLSRFLMQQASRAGRLPRHRLRVSGLQAVGRLVADGVGIAIVPASVTRQFSPSACVSIPLADPWARRRLLICSTREGEQSAGVRSLVEHLSSTTR